MEPHEKIYRKRKEIFFNNIIGGFGWSIGATVGIAILLAVLGFVVSKINLVPIVGNFVGDIAREVLQKNPQLLQ